MVCSSLCTQNTGTLLHSCNGGRMRTSCFRVSITEVTILNNVEKVSKLMCILGEKRCEMVSLYSAMYLCCRKQDKIPSHPPTPKYVGLHWHVDVLGWVGRRQFMCPHFSVSWAFSSSLWQDCLLSWPLHIPNTSNGLDKETSLPRLPCRWGGLEGTAMLAYLDAWNFWCLILPESHGEKAYCFHSLTTGGWPPTMVLAAHQFWDLSLVSG